jgi:membrane protease YdiL (CAAX protease family)
MGKADARAAVLLGVFTLGAIASFTVSVFIVSAALGALAPVLSAIQTPIMIGLVFSLALLALSHQLLTYEGAGLSDLGLLVSRARFREFIAGFAVTSVLFLAIAVAQTVGVRAAWELQGVPGVRAALVGLLSAGVLVLAEELLFRGVALRCLRALYGDRAAILLSAVLFGAYHLVQSDDWAMGAVFRFLTPTLGGLLFGWAALRSRGLSLPLGLHLGGNWVQASLAGFAPNEMASDAPVQALWRIPISADDVRALTAPDIGPQLPYLVAVVLAAAATSRLLRRSSPDRLSSRVDR